MPKNTLALAYYRVSTNQQKTSGLGLETQKNTVRQFCASMNLIAEYTETESGANDDRPALSEAIRHAKETGATLVIAKLDRLSRNAGFIFTLRDSGVNFVCADMPDANTLTIGIFAALAQHEREIISERTKSALAAKKAQGFRLGSPQNLQQCHRVKGAQQRHAQALVKPANQRAIAMIRHLRAQSPQPSHHRTAHILNTSGFTTARGGRFHASTVQYLEKLGMETAPVKLFE